MVEVIERSQPIIRKRLKPSEFGPWTVDKTYYDFDIKKIDSTLKKHSVAFDSTKTHPNKPKLKSGEIRNKLNIRNPGSKRHSLTSTSIAKIMSNKLPPSQQKHNSPSLKCKWNDNSLYNQTQL